MKEIKKGDIAGNEYILPLSYFWCTLKYLHFFADFIKISETNNLKQFTYNILHNIFTKFAQ